MRNTNTSPALPVESLTELEGLGRDMLQALKECQSRDLSQLALATVATRVEDPWDLLAENPNPSIVWSNSLDGSALAGYGLAYDRSLPFGVATIEDADRLGLNANHCWRKDPSRDGVPLTFWGIRFGGSKGRDSPWLTWPALRVFVPEIMVYKRAAESVAHIRLAVWIDARTEESDIWDSLDRVRELLRPKIPAALPLVMSDSDRLPCIPESQPHWNARIAGLVEAIRAGKVEKVVAARCERSLPSEGSVFDLVQTLQTLRKLHPKCAVFSFAGKDGSFFIGATPETLVRVKNKRVHTHALAGTVARGETEDEDECLRKELLSSTKDHVEQQHVVEAVRIAMEGYVDGIAYPKEPSILRLTRVQHLVTEFVGNIRDETHPLELVFRMHPTPAVSGTPPQDARKWIAEREAMDRGWYAGPIGWMALNEDCAFRVALRSALLTPKQMIAYAGAGIVAASDAELEWNETALKLRTMQDAVVEREMQP